MGQLDKWGPNAPESEGSQLTVASSFFEIQQDAQILVPRDGQSVAATQIAAALSNLKSGLLAGASIFTSQAEQQGVRVLDRGETGGRQVLMCQTSGSTGQPKVIRRSPESWKASFDVTQDRYAVGATDGYAVLGALGGSLVLYAVMEAFHIGAPLLALNGILPARQRRALAENAVRVVYATPTQMRLLAVAEGPTLADIKWIFCGGGRLDRATRDVVQTMAPNAELREFYGSSETSFIAMSSSTTPPDCVGQAYPGVEIEIRDLLGRPTREAGEIWVRSPYVFEGYAEGSSDSTRWDSSFLTVGEMGQLRADGNLQLLGRRDRMVTVSDVNVFPEAIETLVMELGVTSGCAAIPVADQKRGSAIHLVVAGIENSDLVRAIRRHCRERLGASSVPQQVIFMDQLPSLSSGKPDLQGIANRLGRTT